MEYQLNKNVVLVCGKVNGAIYNFESTKVYSINKVGKDIILKFIKKCKLNHEEQDYINELIDESLMSPDFEPYEIYNDYTKPIPKLEMAWLEVTEACNLKCIHCYEGNCHKKFENGLNLEKRKNIIDQLDFLNVKRVIVIGGEPCCYPNIIDLIDYCGTKKFETTLFTNATFMTEKLIEAIKKANVKVKISIYAGNSELHDKITTIKGAFNKMDDNILRLKSMNINVSASIILMKENQFELDRIKDYIKSRGISYGGYDIIRNVFGGSQSIHTPDNFDIIAPKYFAKPSFKANYDTFVNNHFVNSCWFGKIAIQEDGNIIPCVFHRNISLGNVNKNSIYEIINSKETFNCWYYNFDKVNECCFCEFRFACKDCRAIGFGVSGNINEKNPRCLYTPSLGKWEEIK